MFGFEFEFTMCYLVSKHFQFLVDMPFLCMRYMHFWLQNKTFFFWSYGTHLPGQWQYYSKTTAVSAAKKVYLL